MATPDDLFRWWDAHVLGHPYDADSDVRFGPKFYDCSGSVWATLVHGAGIPGDWVPTTSWAQARWLSGHGILDCSSSGVNRALWAPGWLVFRGPRCGMDGFGNLGHVALTDGRGGIREAQGHAAGCVHDQPFPGEFIAGGPIPGITYRSIPTTQPLPPPADYAAIIRYAKGLRRQAYDALGRILVPVLRQGNGIPGGSEQVRLWQNALNVAIRANLVLDGEYGPRTAFATGVVQANYSNGGTPVTGAADVKTRNVCRYLLAAAGMA